METRFWKSWRLFALTFLACLNGWSGHGVVFAKPQFESTQPRLLRDALQMAGDPEGLSGTGDPATGFFPAQVAAEVRLNFLNANSRRAFVVADPAGRDKPRDVGPRFSFNSSRRFAANLQPTLANAHSAPSSLRLTTHRMKESKIGESPRAQAPVTKFHFQIENTGSLIAENTTLAITIHGEGQINAIFPEIDRASPRIIYWNVGELGSGETWRGRFEMTFQKGMSETMTPRIIGNALSRFSKSENIFR